MSTNPTPLIVFLSCRPCKRPGRFGPRSACAIWREDSGGAEVNPWIVLDLSTGGERYRVMYEFPKLYRCRRRERIPIAGGRGVVCQGEPRPRG